MRAAAALAPLRLRDFRLVWSAQTVSRAGDTFHSVAVAWLVLQLTSSAFALGGVLTARAVASTALLLLGGVAVDRLTPRTLMLVSASSRCVLVAGMALLVASGTAALWQVLTFEAVFGLADAFSLPADGSIAPTLLPDHHLEAASALDAISDNVSRSAGPLLAGAAVAAAGVAPALGVDALSFGVAALLIGATRAGAPAEVAPRERGLLKQIGEGVGHVFRIPALRAVLLLYMAGCLGLGGPYLVGLPALTVGHLSGGAFTLGLLFGAWGLGQLAGNLTGGIASVPQSPGRRIGLLVIGTGAAWAAVGVARPLAVALAAIAAAGIADGVAEVLAPAWAQRAADPRLLGRVMGTLELSRALLLPVALIVSGALAGPAPGLLFAAGGALVILSGVAAVAASRPN